jgi:5-methylthioadenosine/S-adenosylhomocysteine deaminase
VSSRLFGALVVVVVLLGGCAGWGQGLGCRGGGGGGTPAGVVPDGWLEIEGGKIIRMYTSRPVLAGVKAVATEDYIFAGFVDLHNHPMYNIYPRWTPPHKYPNRYAWRDSEEYKAVLDRPNRMIAAGGESFCDIDEYVEVKALIGGTTSMIGISGARPAGGGQPAKTTPECVKGLVRNLESYTGFYGPDVDRERIVNSIGILPRDMNAHVAAGVAKGIRDGDVDLLAIHIAEGLPTDAESASEVDALEAKGLLGAHTVLIHAVGLSPSQMARVHRAGAAIVWSPRSNFELYGQTANVVAAFDEGVTTALAPDWAPNGSDNMLDEIKYASGVSREKLGGLFSARALVEMASSVPAGIARIDDKVGTIAAGQYGDFFLLKVKGANPYEALVGANVKDVDMVFINGVPVYGAPERFAGLGIATEALEVCGVKKVLNIGALPAGSFAGVQGRLEAKMKGAGITLAPLAECVQ